MAKRVTEDEGRAAFDKLMVELFDQGIIGQDTAFWATRYTGNNHGRLVGLCEIVRGIAARHLENCETIAKFHQPPEAENAG